MVIFKNTTGNSSGHLSKEKCLILSTFVPCKSCDNNKIPNPQVLELLQHTQHMCMQHLTKLEWLLPPKIAPIQIIRKMSQGQFRAFMFGMLYREYKSIKDDDCI